MFRWIKRLFHRDNTKEFLHEEPLQQEQNKLDPLDMYSGTQYISFDENFPLPDYDNFILLPDKLPQRQIEDMLNAYIEFLLDCETIEDVAETVLMLFDEVYKIVADDLLLSNTIYNVELLKQMRQR